jgi:hypothetical protein
MILKENPAKKSMLPEKSGKIILLLLESNSSIMQLQVAL